MKLKPVEFKVLIEVDSVEEKSAGGIILPEDVRDRNQYAQERGTLVAVGGNAFEDWREPKPQVGDRVLFEKYGGKLIDDSNEYRLCNDKDITAVITEE